MQAFTSRDSAGIRIVVNASVPEVVWSLSPSPVLIIGDDESKPETQLFQAYSATRLLTGELAVANSGSGEIIIFGEDGSRRRTLGRRGDGPGEFTSSIRVIPSTGHAVVAEQLGVRPKLVSFTVSGEVNRELQRSIRPMPGAWSSPVTSPTGTVFILGEDLPQPQAYSSQTSRLPSYLVRHTYESIEIDTIAEYSGAEYFAADVGPRPSFGGGSVPGPRAVEPLFRARTVSAAGGDPWRVAVGDQALASFDLFAEDGTLLQRVRWNARGRTPTSEQVTIATAALLNAPVWRQDPNAARRVGDILQVPDHTPVFRALAVDRSGHVWVERYPLPLEQESTWWVFDFEGRAIASIEMPHAITVHEIGEAYIIGGATDDLGIERIEVWELLR